MIPFLGGPLPRPSAAASSRGSRRASAPPNALLLRWPEAAGGEEGEPRGWDSSSLRALPS
eukprot:2020954-Pyramimonas_sp.AAC.1